MCGIRRMANQMHKVRRLTLQPLLAVLGNVMHRIPQMVRPMLADIIMDNTMYGIHHAAKSV